MTLQAIAQAGLGTRIAHDPGDPLITSHCPFCGSGQVIGRSDGTIECDFCGQNYIVRVQPAFPGMPQAPGEGGAPSDIGPDGGVIPPDAIGPDGLPMDPMADPEAEGEEDAPPFPDDGGEEEDEGPPADDGEDDDAPPPAKTGPPPKSKKKSARTAVRTYRTATGQVLTEDQYLRHLAASFGGPQVLAQLRTEAAARHGRLEYTPHVREVLPLHMMSHHGWSPDEVKEAMGWPEASNALPRHHDAEHATAHSEHLPVPHAHEDVSHSLYQDKAADPMTSSDRDWLHGSGIEASRADS